MNELRQRFCTEMQYKSYGQTGLAWGAIFETITKDHENMCFQKRHGRFSRNSFQSICCPSVDRKTLAKGSSRAEPLENAGGSGGENAAPPLEDSILLQCEIDISRFPGDWNGSFLSISRFAGDAHGEFFSISRFTRCKSHFDSQSGLLDQ